MREVVSDLLTAVGSENVQIFALLVFKEAKSL
jgi:hypothetical protein